MSEALLPNGRTKRGRVVHQKPIPRAANWITEGPWVKQLVYDNIMRNGPKNFQNDFQTWPAAAGVGAVESLHIFQDGDAGTGPPYIFCNCEEHTSFAIL